MPSTYNTDVKSRFETFAYYIGNNPARIFKCYQQYVY